MTAQLAGRDCRSFAYPYGDFDSASKRLVEEAGFACACNADGGFVRRSSDPFALPRIQAGNWDSRRLAQRIGHA
jgi:peptidoglycan/xylan/chitin deacetylase (PgdA/CDA1 family)